MGYGELLGRRSLALRPVGSLRRWVHPEPWCWMSAALPSALGGIQVQPADRLDDHRGELPPWHGRPAVERLLSEQATFAATLPFCLTGFEVSSSANVPKRHD
jgi:hypothetical protein